MGTFKGQDYVLTFKCKDCNLTSFIDIDPDKKEDGNRLLQWLQTHSAQGGMYENKYKLHNQKEIEAMIIDGWSAHPEHKTLTKNGIKIRMKDIDKFA